MSEDGGRERRFELRGYWIERGRKSDYYYRYWYDPRRRRVRSRTLKTKNWEEAKEALAAFVLTTPPERGDDVPLPSKVLMLAVLDHYLENHARKLPSAGSAERAIALFTEWLFEVKHLPDTAKADVFRLDYQEEFVRWSAAQKHSAKYISRNLSTVASALKFAAAEKAISDDDGERRIVQLMTHAPKVQYDPHWIAATAKIAAPQRRRWVPSMEEMALFIDCVRAEHVQRYMILALNTWGRATTIMELDLKLQVDEFAGLVDLNPPGRLQTHKRRPIIRLTENLRSWRAHWKMARPLQYKGATVESVKRGFQNANARWMLTVAGLPAAEIRDLMTKPQAKERTRRLQELEAKGVHRITRRIVRTFMATRVRSQREIPVDREQRQIWLGHLSQDTTSSYEVMDPAYLREAAAATDLILSQLDGLCQTSLWPIGEQLDLLRNDSGVRRTPGGGEKTAPENVIPLRGYGGRGWD